MRVLIKKASSGSNWSEELHFDTTNQLLEYLDTILIRYSVIISRGDSCHYEIIIYDDYVE